MVTEKHSDIQHDFNADGLKLRRSDDGAWLMVSFVCSVRCIPACCACSDPVRVCSACYVRESRALCTAPQLTTSHTAILQSVWHRGRPCSSAADMQPVYSVLCLFCDAQRGECC